MIIDGVNIVACGFNPGRDELKNYVDYTKKKYGDIAKIVVELEENGEVTISWTKYNLPFERIRRITGE